MSALTRAGARPSVRIEIHQRRLLAVSEAAAGRALERFVDRLNADHGTLRLRAAVLLPNLGAEIELRHDVVVALCRGTCEGAAACASLETVRSEDVTFPSLRGRLVVTAASAHASWLCLEGSYEPMSPTLRLAAPAESVVGHRIILATARLLLSEVAHAIGAGT